MEKFTRAAKDGQLGGAPTGGSDSIRLGDPSKVTRNSSEGFVLDGTLSYPVLSLSLSHPTSPLPFCLTLSFCTPVIRILSLIPPLPCPSYLTLSLSTSVSPPSSYHLASAFLPATTTTHP